MNENIVWHHGSVRDFERRKILGQKPMVLWFTGLSGSGKSTIAAMTERKLIDSGYAAYLLDGDNIRHGLNNNLGFSDEDRTENIRRICECAKLFADCGIITLVSAISPLRKMRGEARACIESVCEFAEIYVMADIETCVKRDPKGLYKKAISGELKNFTGISAPYEIPRDPEILLDTLNDDAEKNSDTVFNYIINKQTDYSKLLDIIIPAAVKAGEEIMKIYNRGGAEFKLKDDNSPLTEADTVSNRVICETLEKHFPFYSILAEESKDDLSRLRQRYCFIVDPLDGTKEFIKRNGEFTVNIALAFDGSPILGVIYIPCTNTLYYAYRGGGAYKISGDGMTTKLKASERTENLIVIESRSHGDTRLDELLEKNKDKIADTISAGSSIKGCLIAEGSVDIYYRFGYTMEWDTAAMQCICEEAGAVFMQGDDSPLTYNRRNSLNEKGFYILNKIENKLHLCK